MTNEDQEQFSSAALQALSEGTGIPVEALRRVLSQAHRRLTSQGHLLSEYEAIGREERYRALEKLVRDSTIDAVAPLLVAAREQQTVLDQIMTVLSWNLRAPEGARKASSVQPTGEVGSGGVWHDLAVSSSDGCSYDLDARVDERGRLVMMKAGHTLPDSIEVSCPVSLCLMRIHAWEDWDISAMGPDGEEWGQKAGYCYAIVYNEHLMGIQVTASRSGQLAKRTFYLKIRPLGAL